MVLYRLKSPDDILYVKKKRFQKTNSLSLLDSLFKLDVRDCLTHNWKKLLILLNIMFHMQTLLRKLQKYQKFLANFW